MFRKYIFNSSEIKSDVYIISPNLFTPSSVKNNMNFETYSITGGNLFLSTLGAYCCTGKILRRYRKHFAVIHTIQSYK